MRVTGAMLWGGGQTWIILGLRVTERAIVRSILGRRDKIGNKAVRSAQTTNIEYKIKKLKFSYAEHVARAHNDR